MSCGGYSFRDNHSYRDFSCDGYSDGGCVYSLGGYLYVAYLLSGLFIIRRLLLLQLFLWRLLRRRVFLWRFLLLDLLLPAAGSSAAKDPATCGRPIKMTWHIYAQILSDRSKANKHFENNRPVPGTIWNLPLCVVHGMIFIRASTTHGSSYISPSMATNSMYECVCL